MIYENELRTLTEVFWLSGFFFQKYNKTQDYSHLSMLKLNTMDSDEISFRIKELKQLIYVENEKRKAAQVIHIISNALFEDSK